MSADVISRQTQIEATRTDYDLFLSKVQEGTQGMNDGIPFGFPRMDNYVSLRKGTLYVLGGFTGSGKTSIVDEMFVLNPYEFILRHNLRGKLRITYWSMERNKVLKLAKWTSRRIFRDRGILIPIEKIMGWKRRTMPLTSNEHDLIKEYKPYFDEMLEYVTIIDGRQNPTGIRKYKKEYAERFGRIHQIDEYNKVYEPEDPSIIHVDIYDHAGKVKKEQGKNQKDTIDDLSDDCSNTYRDFYGHSEVILSQFNRDISNIMRLKAGDVEPRMEDFKSTGDLAEDSEIVMSLFDPWRYKVADPSGYNLDKLRDAQGIKKYRNLKILKNSYGGEDINVGIAYQPQTGIFKEMPRADDMTNTLYTSILDNSYFL